MPALDIGVSPHCPRWLSNSLKLGRYPKSRVSHVTIAAGFRCVDGIVIGADTRVEEGNVKYQENKVFECCDDDGYGFVIAGAGDFEPINNCVDLIRSRKIWQGATATTATLKEALRRFTEGTRYQKLVERQPAAPGGFAILVGLRSMRKETDLLYLSGMELYPVPEYRCIGAGAETALFVAKWLYSPDFSVEAFGPLALQIFRAAKGHNAGCDDATHVFQLFDTVAPDTMRHRVIDDSEFLWGLQQFLKPLIRCCVDAKTPDEEMEHYLKHFEDKIRFLRATMRQPTHSAMPPELKRFLESTGREPKSVE